MLGVEILVTASSSRKQKLGYVVGTEESAFRFVPLNVWPKLLEKYELVYSEHLYLYLTNIQLKRSSRESYFSEGELYLL